MFGSLESPLVGLLFNNVEVLTQGRPVVTDYVQSCVFLSRYAACLGSLLDRSKSDGTFLSFCN